MKKSIWFISIALCANAFAAPAPQTYELTVMVGSKKTEFKVEGIAQGGQLTKKSSTTTKVVKLSKLDSDYLKKQFGEILKMKSHDPQMCASSMVILSAGSTVKPVIACARSPLPVARRSKRLANLLNLTAKLRK